MEQRESDHVREREREIEGERVSLFSFSLLVSFLN